MNKLPALILLITSLPALAQITDKEDILSKRNKRANSIYLKSVKPNQLVLNGKNYYEIYPETAGHQYIETKTYVSSTIVFDRIKYENVPLNYDIFNDELITSIYQDGKVKYMILDKSRVDEFFINELQFINVRDSLIDDLPVGIYEQVYKNGKMQLLIKRKKDRSKMAQATYLKYRYRFNIKDEYLLINAMTVSRISNKKDILNAVENREEANQFIKENGLRLKENQSSFIPEIIQLLIALNSTN